MSYSWDTKDMKAGQADRWMDGRMDGQTDLGLVHDTSSYDGEH